METFSALLVICAGNSPVTGGFPTQRPVAPRFDVFFDLRLSKRLSKQSWGWWFETPSRPLWRQCNVESEANYNLVRFIESCLIYQTSNWCLSFLSRPTMKIRYFKLNCRIRWHFFVNVQRQQLLCLIYCDIIIRMAIDCHGQVVQYLWTRHYSSNTDIKCVLCCPKQVSQARTCNCIPV